MAFSEKFVCWAGVGEAAGRTLKRYQVSAAGAPIEDEIRDAADRFVASLLPEPDEEMPPAGFTVLHRNSQGAFLDAFSWVWTNVIECRTSAAGIPFLGCEDEDPTNFRPLDRPWIGCVWELAPLEHERKAWVRHVLVPDVPDLAAYLADRFPDGMTSGSR